ncbi:hypothetical protein BDZ89DRAFT_300267 [Hymenopellis radicata]|nr:hypothetical protein BDZ89DRAFT_300267 [Hymenopellis radicata]
MNVLKKWTPSAYEHARLSPQNLVIKDMTLQVILQEIVPLVPGTTNHFLFSHEHAANWLNTLLELLEYIELQVNTQNPSTAEHSELMECLTRLHLLLTTIPRDLWSLQSLASAVDKSLKELNTDDNEDDDDLDDPLKWKGKISLQFLPFLMPSSELQLTGLIFPHLRFALYGHYTQPVPGYTHPTSFHVLLF